MSVEKDSVTAIVDGEISTKYTYKLDIGGKNFTLTLDNGIPTATYTGTDSVAATLDTTTYSFSVDSKPVEVVVKNDAISSVTVDSKQVDTSGNYSVGTKQLQISYADGSLTAQTAPINSVVDISSVTSYKIGDTIVTVTNGKLSTTSATLNGHNATLSYDSTTKTTGDPNTLRSLFPTNQPLKSQSAMAELVPSHTKAKSITETEGSYPVGDGKLD